MRFWKDIEGQEKRGHVRARICPVSGPGSMNRSERERKAKEIIAESQVDTTQYFNRVVTQQFGVTFKEQSKIWLQQSQTRKRKPIRATTVPTIKAALDKWILPELGDLPLSETAKYSPMKSLVAKLNAAGLSAQTVNATSVWPKQSYSLPRMGKAIPLYERKWDAEKLDLPVVETSKQRRPSITADVMAEFAQTRKPKYRMVFILAASSGCRIGEILGLEIKDLLDDLTTIRVVQQAKGTKLTLDLKTINSQRFVDICPEVAALLKEFIGGRTSGLVFSSRTGKPLHPSNLIRRVIHPLLERKVSLWEGTTSFGGSD